MMRTLSILVLAASTGNFDEDFAQASGFDMLLNIILPSME